MRTTPFPRARYTSPEFAELEFERLWSRVWQVACREEEIAEVGEFCEYLIGDQSILVVRSDPDTVRAFHNTCLHRGTRLADGTGCFPDGCIRCRYHAWRYDLDGRLVEVVDEDEFDPIPPDTGLKAVQVDRWGGFVWVCLDPGAPPLLEYLDPLPTLLAPYHLDRLRIRTYLSTVLPANWKVAVDAFNEGYHVQGTHPQLLPWTDDVSLEYEPLGLHAHYGRLPERAAPTASEPAPRASRGRLRRGRDPRELRPRPRRPLLPRRACAGGGDPRHTPRRRDNAEPLSERDGVTLLVARGVAVEEFADDQLTSADDVYFFPNMVGPIYPGIAILFRVRPNGTDPGQLHQGHVVPAVASGGRASEAGRAPILPRLDRARLGRDHQPGLRQHGARADRDEVPRRAALRLNRRQESNVLHMHRMIDRYLTSLTRRQAGDCEHPGPGTRRR